jgi:hypothetical protein
MIGRLLCRVGFHNWRVRWRGHEYGMSETLYLRSFAGNQCAIFCARRCGVAGFEGSAAHVVD